MSRNFELLQRVGAKREAFVVPPRPFVASRDERGEAKLERLVRQEISKLVERVFLAPKNGPRAVLFTGVESDEGSSAVCARAGEALAARVSDRVCLLDVNLSCPTLHARFGIPNARGLADAVRQVQPANGLGSRVAGQNLWLVPAGSTERGPNSVWCSERLRAVLGGLREQYEYVLINAPPAGVCSETLALGRAVDGVILVAEANSTRRETARRAKESLGAAGVRLLGTVLNNRSFPIPEKLYRRI